MTKQVIDPVIEEIHEIRREIARRFNYDIRELSNDARRRQELEGRPLWRPESPVTRAAPECGSSIGDDGQSSPVPG
jgi:hypothetical protein